jgi:hypothetical protein
MERWNLSAKWAAGTDLNAIGVYDHVGKTDYTNSIQLTYLDSQKLYTNMRTSQARSSAVLHDPLSSRHLKFEV